MKKIKPKKLLKLYMSEALAAAGERPPRCPHFAECGGCEYQNFPYPAQLAAKKAVWERLTADAGLSLPPADIVASPEEFGYRQRMDYVFAFGTAGLRRRGSHRKVVALTQCPLLGEQGFAAFSRARELAEEMGLESYDYLRHTGFLRYFVIRRTRNGEVLLSLVTSSQEHPEAIEKIASALLAEGRAVSVYWLLNSTLSDLSFGKVLRFWGAEHIREIYGGKQFYIGANTFAQANPAVAEIAYRKIAAANSGESRVCDAYSGTGAIGELLAPHCGAVVAVENIPDNLRLAALHAQINGAANITTVNADAREFLSQLAAAPTAADMNFSAVVVNPPRAGLEDKAARALAAAAVPRLTYMSCNPQTLIADLRILLPVYTAESVTLFDMFPQTHHWETLIVMRRAAASS